VYGGGSHRKSPNCSVTYFNGETLRGRVGEKCLKPFSLVETPEKILILLFSDPLRLSVKAFDLMPCLTDFSQHSTGGFRVEEGDQTVVGTAPWGFVNQLEPLFFHFYHRGTEALRKTTSF